MAEIWGLFIALLSLSGIMSSCVLSFNAGGVCHAFFS
jgi:hypothetical protein